jgi:hypothetical protein
MNKTKKKPFGLLGVIRYFFIFLLIVFHIQFVRGTSEIIPGLFPSLAKETQAEVTEKFIRSSRSVSTARGSNTSHNFSYYIAVSFRHADRAYVNEDLVSEELYDQLKVGDPVVFLYLDLFPQTGLLKMNVSYAIKNSLTLTLLLLGIDISILAIFIWIRRKRRKENKANKRKQR